MCLEQRGYCTSCYAATEAVDDGFEVDLYGLVNGERSCVHCFDIMSSYEMRDDKGLDRWRERSNQGFEHRR